MEENFDDLLKDLRSLGLSPTEEEIRMKEFVSQFGGGLKPEDFAEYLYDYYHHPEEYDIDDESEYYDSIIEYYEEISKYARSNLSGPMRFGNYERWNKDGIRMDPIYKLYIKMSS